MKMAVNTLLGFVFLVLGVAAMPAFADEDKYYIEIGGDVSKDDAAKQWQELVAQHKALLGKLTFYPKSIIHSGAAVSTRIQAGPIADKPKAERICRRLFATNVACFVIEGLGEKPATQMMNLSEKAEEQSLQVVQLPWSPNSDVPPPPPVAPAAPEPENATQETEKQGSVHVAEAIRVPLTENEAPQGNAQIVSKPLPSLDIQQAKDGPYANESKDSGAGWLTVKSFPNEDVASSFWEEVRSGNSVKTKDLHVRVLTPLLAGNATGTSLGIGPFTSSSDAYAFCRETLQASARGLGCSFAGEPLSEPADASALGAHYLHNDAYAARREAVERNRPAENPAIPGDQYWVQVASAPTQMEALRMWDNLKSGNQDVLAGMRSSVSSSLADKNNFVVRVGPLGDSASAGNLCTTLHGRGVDCRVVVYTPNQ